MAKRLSEIFSPSFMFESIKRQGLLRSAESGLKLLTHRVSHAFYRTRVGRSLHILLSRADSTESTLYVFYDLAVAAPGYDIVNFLVLAEKFRLEHTYADMHLVFVPPEGDAVKKFEQSKNLLDSGDYVTRLHTILTPACYLFPSCNGFTVCGTRAHASAVLGTKTDVFPANYTVKAPVPMVKLRYFREAIERGEKIPSINAPARMKQAVQRWINSRARGKKVITITLRESTYVQDRNSNIEAWAAFAHNLQGRGDYFPVVIRDTEKVAEELPPSMKGLTTSPEASMHLLFRTALYEESYLNLIINNGPAMLCLFDENIKYLFFKVVTASNPSSTVEFLRDDQGMYVDEPFPGSNPYQRLVWEDDTLDVIEREFKSMCQLIESSSQDTAK